MIKKVLFFLVVSSILILAGCETVPEQPQPVVVVPAPQPPQNQEALKALAQLSDMKQELKNLRNTVEELQFETENAKRRQQDLFQDLDRRMVDFERNQAVLAAQQTTDNQIDSNNGAVLIGTDTTTLTTDADPSITETGDAATEVVVVSDTSEIPTQPSSDAEVAISGSVTLDEQNAYEQSFDLLKQSRYEDAILGFQQLVDTWPASPLADDAYYWMSEARYVNREFEHALSGFRTLVSRYPDSQRVPEALLKIGYIQYDIGIYDDAAETFRDILARFPGHQVTVSAQTRLRRIEQTIQ